MGIIIRPIKANTRKAMRRLNAWEMYPIMGGPISIPTMLYVAMIEMASPGEYFLL